MVPVPVRPLMLLAAIGCCLGGCGEDGSEAFPPSWTATAASGVGVLVHSSRTAASILPRLFKQVQVHRIAASWPNKTSTGVPAGTVLTVVKGNLAIRTAGTVIDAKDIRGCVSVTAPGVVIRRSRIRCAQGYAVRSAGYTGSRLLIEDSEIDCKDDRGFGTRTTAVGDNNFTASRLDIHDCENGFDVDVDVTIRDSWIHDLLDGDMAAHTDGIQIAVGRNILIERNAIFVKGTSAIISHPTTMSGVVIRNNLLAGGAYTLYCPRDRSSDVRVLDNRFSRIYYPNAGAYGAWTDCDKVVELRGNVWDDTGQLLPGQP